jgi:hypothetical protein
MNYFVRWADEIIAYLHEVSESCANAIFGFLDCGSEGKGDFPTPKFKSPYIRSNVNHQYITPAPQFESL